MTTPMMILKRSKMMALRLCMCLVLLLSLAVSSSVCPSSSKAEEYTQQFQIGDTGPNGGTVTQVTVTSEIVDQSTALINGFEETTTQTKYVETVTEEIQENVTTTQTTAVITTVSTGNMLDPASDPKTTTGTILDHTHHHHFDYRGGSVTYTNRLGDYIDNPSDWQNGFDITGRTGASACTNMIGGDCSSGLADTLTITVRVTDPVTGETYQQAQSFAVTNSYQYFSTTLNVPTNTLGSDTEAAVTFFGIDNGFWGGWYGPVIQDMSLTATYDQTQLITNTITELVTTTIDTVINQTLESVEKKFVGDPTDTAQTATVEITVTDTGTGGTVAQTSFDMPMQVDMPSASSGPDTQQSASTEMGSSSSQSQQTESSPQQQAVAQVEAKMEQQSSSSDSKSESSSESKSSSSSSSSKSESKSNDNKKSSSDKKSDNDKKSDDNKSEDKTEAKQKIATEIVKDILSKMGNDTAAQATQLALMNAIGADPSKIQPQIQDASQWYQTSQLPDKELKDPTAALFNSAQDAIHSKMVDMQYGR